MRFYADGPNIPDQLLELRDQGKVVFFCGAGVSRNEGLDDFVQLTQAVLDHFDPPVNFNSYQTFYSNKKEHGIAILDQVFYFLHQEFGVNEVNQVVAERLSSDKKIAKSHQNILRISSNLDGIPQVVTTNFDHLFELYTSVSTPTYEAPSLPNLALTGSVSGITYLHGKLKSPQDENHDYILSSADFGRAYLSQAWATEFVRSLLENFTVVLLGYQAEDPPIKYLLQGLHHNNTVKQHSIYALDVEGNNTQSKWRDKGVIPIPCNGIPELWSSIEAWAERADNPRDWRTKTLDLATKKPQDLEAFERGQVAHIVHTTAGAKAFSTQKPTPPPEWLCVFDPKCRMAAVAKNFTENTTFDPSEAYGLDGDPAREEIKSKRIKIDEEKNLLHWNTGDIKHTRPLNLTDSYQDIPNRLFALAQWITFIIDSPITVWWVLKQDKVHSYLLDMLISAVNRNDSLEEKAKQFWNLAFTYHKRQYFLNSEIDSKFELLDRIKKNDWPDTVLREFEALTTPYISIEQPIGLARANPPKNNWVEIHPYDLAEWKIKGIDIDPEKLNIPAEVLPTVFRILETQLIKQDSLRHVVSEFRSSSPTCYREREVKGRSYDGDELFNLFLAVFKQLIQENPLLAKSHVLTWPTNHSECFELLKLFAINQKTLFTPEEAFDYLMALDDQEFWDTNVCRELLFLIMDRYSELSESQQKKLIDKLFSGPKINPENGMTVEKVTRATCRYIRRLQLGGVKINSIQQEKFEELSSTLPDWSDEWAQHITQIDNGGSYHVSTDESAGPLEKAPIYSIADLAIKVGTRDIGERVEIKPFIGLVKKSPRKALLALGAKRKQNEFPFELWEQLIKYISVDIAPREMRFFLARVSTLPVTVLKKHSYSLTQWMEKQRSFLIANHPELFWYLFDQITNAIRCKESNKTRYESAKSFPASNLSGGILAEILLKLIDSLHLEQPQRIPDNIKLRLHNLLNLSPAISNRVICEVTENLYWVSNIDPEWVHQNIICYFQLDEPQAPAAWKGYIGSNKLWLNKACSQKIYPLIITLFPTIYGNEWDKNLSNRAAVILVELTLNGIEEDWKVSFDDMRRCLRHMTLKNIQNVISRLKQIGQNDSSDWEKKVIPFIKQAWPKEKNYQKPEMTTNWLYLLATTGVYFPSVLNAVSPFLKPIQGFSIPLTSFYRSKDGTPLAQLFPKDTLDLLDKLIMDTPNIIPYEVPKMLDIITESDPPLLNSAKYKRLIAIIEGG
ncbi:SIR2 family protein [Marinomonas sp. RSW2]|uniref:SIR2 family protein n=1 Tax=Marinomonas maritima TaxID=2940935 RepID=A0ABT5WC83_9GAMM|nr:SIR2 family protein [Marinomonas maritima]MDE8601665.1 SIR2 family protein [Marinomonas maritima]